MTRAHLNHEEREAMRVLDMVRAGLDVSDEMVRWALFVTGDSVGLA
jgi:hypothetical protein